MPNLTTVRKIFPHVFIAPTIDNTSVNEGREVGAMCGVGYYHIGNPNYPVSISYTNVRAKSINPLFGGSIKNETLYHIQDHITQGNARVWLARMLGVDSTLNLITTDDGLTLSNIRTTNIFGANGLKSWLDTTAVSPFEIAVGLCPEHKVTAKVDYSHIDRVLEVGIYDEFGNKLYVVAGNIDATHLDDYGKSDFIGNKTDEKHLMIKLLPSNAIFNTSFSITKDFVNGLVTDAGADNLTVLQNVLSTVAKKSDYMASMGIQDPVIIKMLIAVANEAIIKTIVDIKAGTIDEVEAFIASVGIYDDSAYWLWSRSKYKFDAGVFNIGLSGWFTGKNANRNLSRMNGLAEYRNSGIAGVNHPISRTLPNELEPLSDDEKTRLTKMRVNTIEEDNGVLVLSDVLSSQSKATHLMKFPTADSLAYIKRSLGIIALRNLYDNLAVSKANVQREANTFMKDCRGNMYFDNNVPIDEQFKLNISDANGDTVIVEFVCFMEGIARKGEVYSKIKSLGA